MLMDEQRELPGLSATPRSFAAPIPQVLDVDLATAREIANAAHDIAARHAGHQGPHRLDNHDLMLDCAVALRTMSPELLVTLLDFRVRSSADGVLLLRGLPVDDPLPATPADGYFDGAWGDLAVSTVAQLIVTSAFGDVIAYEDEKRGRLVQDICPVPGAETHQENTGSILLELHTEDGFHPSKPHFISLMCLRSDHDEQAQTVAAGVRAVLAHLDPAHVNTLRQPQFRIRVARSFSGSAGARYSAPTPVLSGSRTDPDLCIDIHAMEPMTDAAADAFDAIRSAMLRSLVGAVLQPGDLLVIDNRKAVHGRTAFTPRYDERDRWLRRCFAVTDIRVPHERLRPTSRVHRPVAYRAFTARPRSEREMTSR
jgi:L-asparagine oxygenase